MGWEMYSLDGVAEVFVAVRDIRTQAIYLHTKGLCFQMVSGVRHVTHRSICQLVVVSSPHPVNI